ncbi:MAG: type 1 glutamine amidotransferase [Candidatus Kaiserbacteria bacterium]|nr:type 1 glutamine amidotransferase [Candidatus Kaiserbacteria bacterium]
MKRILVVQSRVTETRIERERENYRRTIGDRAEVSFLSALDEQLAWNAPADFLKGNDGVIFGGSSDFDFHGGRREDDPARIISMVILSRTRDLISYALENDVPVLGVCFGHQIIGQMHNGMVSNDREQSKLGSYEVALTEAGKSDPLFADLPERFFAQYAHKDSVTNMPDGATLLATGSACRFSALKYGKKVYTVQFHPEVKQFRHGPDQKESPEASKLVPRWIERMVG